MTYERERLNKTCAENEVVIKKSSLTAMTIAIIAMLVIMGGLIWQNYQQQDQINNLSGRTATVTQQAT